MTTVEDKSRVGDVLKRLSELSSYSVRVGILSKKGGEILMIANVNEYGCNIPVTDKMRSFFRYNFGIYLKSGTTSINIPERSFVRASYDYNKSSFYKFDDYFFAVLDGKLDVMDFYKIVGTACVSMIKDFIIKGVNPEDSSLTLKLKAPKTKPLVDTGRLVNSIDFEVIRV